MKRAPIKKLPAASEIKSIFDYDPVSGEMRWKRRPETGRGAKIFNKRFAGKCVGWIDVGSGGYLRVEWLGATWFVHRIIWKLVTGEDAPEFIDHEDRNVVNNRWKNLRCASHAQNMWNAKLFHNNKSGHKGVSFIQAHRKWRAAISVNGRKKHLGYFETADEAGAAVAFAWTLDRDAKFVRAA